MKKMNAIILTIFLASLFMISCSLGEESSRGSSLEGTVDPCGDDPRIRDIYGPEEFFRKKGKPFTEEKEFSASFPGDYCLVVVNGEDDPPNGRRISAAVISVDGETIIGPDSFNQNVGHITKSLHLAEGQHLLGVQLRSKPESYLVITIKGIPDDLEPPVIAIDTPVEYLSLIEDAGYPVEYERPLIPGIYVDSHAVTVGGTVTDVDSGIDKVLINDVTAIVDDGRFSAEVSLNEGPNIVVALALDSAGNEGTDSIEVVSDTIPPSPPVFDDIPSSTAESKIVLSGKAEPETMVLVTGGTSSARITVDATGELAIRVPLLGNKTNNLTAIAVDAAGNKSTEERFSIVQNIPPKITIIKPTPGTATTYDEVYVVGTVVDTDLSLLTVGGVVTPVVNGEFSSDPVPLTMGVNEIVVSASDDFGSTSTTVVEILRVSEDPPEVFGTVDASTGGRVRVLDRSSAIFGSSVSFPPGSLSANAVVTLKEAHISDPESPIDNPGHIASGPGVELEIIGADIIPALPARLTLPFRSPIVDAIGRRHDLVTVSRLESTGGTLDFVELPGAGVDPGLGLVSVPISDTSVFQAFIATPDYFVVSTEVGNGDVGLEEGIAPNVALMYPTKLAYDKNNDFLYFTQGDISPPPGGGMIINHEVWRLESNGQVRRILNIMDFYSLGYDVNRITCVDVAQNGDLIVGTSNGVQGQVFHVDASTREPTLLAGGGTNMNLNVSPATDAMMNAPTDLEVGPSGEIYVAEGGVWPWPQSVVRKIANGGIELIAGTGETDELSEDIFDGPATSIRLNFAEGVALRSDDNGLLYIADTFSHVVRVVNLSSTESRTANGVQVSPGWMNIVAGVGTCGCAGDGGHAKSAHLRRPFFISVDRRGNLFISERGNAVIRVVDQGGFITRVAGQYGQRGYLDGPATSALLSDPLSIVEGPEDQVSGERTLFIADRGANRIRKLTIPHYPSPGQRDFVCTESCVSYRYLGVNGAEIRIFDEMGNRTVLLLDPYFSRTTDCPDGAGPTCVATINTRIGDQELKLTETLPFVDAVLVTHGHYDHLADIYELQTLSRDASGIEGSGFVIACSESAYNILAGFGLSIRRDIDDGSVIIVSNTYGTVPLVGFGRLNPDNEIISTGFGLSDHPIYKNGNIVVDVTNALHGLAGLFGVLARGNQESPLTTPPTTVGDYLEGGSLSFVLRLGDPPQYTLYIQGGSGHRGDSYGNDQPGLDLLTQLGVTPDMALMNINVYEARENGADPAVYLNFFDGFVPQKVIPLHWDDFFNDPTCGVLQQGDYLNNPFDFETEVSSFVNPDDVVILRYGGCNRLGTNDDATPDFSGIEASIADAICCDTMCPYIDRF